MSNKFKIGDLARYKCSDRVGKIISITSGCVCHLDTGYTVGWGHLEHIDKDTFEQLRSNEILRLEKERRIRDCYLGIAVFAP